MQHTNLLVSSKSKQILVFWGTNLTELGARFSLDWLIQNGNTKLLRLNDKILLFLRFQDNRGLRGRRMTTEHHALITLKGKKLHHDFPSYVGEPLRVLNLDTTCAWRALCNEIDITLTFQAKFIRFW